MFKSISWQEYLLAVSVIAGGYYFIIIAIFYSRDIAAKLKGVAVSKSQPHSVQEKKSTSNFMGAVQNEVKRKPISESVAASEEITIDSNDQKEISQSPDAEVIIDRLEGMFNMMSEGVMEKSRYAKNIKAIVREFWMHKGTPVQSEVTTYIINHFAGNTETSFSIEEIDILWPAQDIESNNQPITINNYETEKRTDQKG